MQPKQGFTLLEVLISLGLIAIALLAVFSLQAQNLDLQSEARFMTVATYLAQDRLARLRVGEGPDPGTRSGDFGEEFPGFRYQEEASESGEIKGLFNLKVKIILEQPGGREREFVAQTSLVRGKG